ncbi:hypothetical protein ACCI51_12070 [Microbulbifer echini]|uniref:Uncharacterized protein n=1 Tax=Microbulbifer echini TaxID=1529067 RepID=A0ABV4NQA5_9GAMM
MAQEYCNDSVECSASYFEDHTSYPTLKIPREKPIDTKADVFSGNGVAFNDVKFDISAPVSAILGAYTLAPVDPMVAM